MNKSSKSSTSDKSSSLHFQYISQDIIYETKNLIVIPCLISLAPGHVIIFTKDQVSLTFAKMTPERIIEYESLLKTVITDVEKCFGPCFAFESGVWGQSMPQAHTHIVPKSGPGYKIESLHKEMLSKSRLPITQIKSIVEITDPEYIFLREDKTSYWCKTYPNKYEPDKQYMYLKFRTYISHKFNLLQLEHWRNATAQIHNEDIKRRDETIKRLKFQGK